MMLVMLRTFFSISDFKYTKLIGDVLVVVFSIFYVAVLGISFSY